MSNTANPGLEGVVAAETRLSHVDGDAGVLVINGEHVEALSGRRSFEAVCAGLWQKPEVSLGAARVKAFERITLFDLADGMDALRAAMAQLPDMSDATLVTAAVGVAAAGWARRRAGLPVLQPDPRLSHARDLVRMVRGEDLPVLAEGLDAYLVAVIDHGMNASTFTARVIASTGSDLVSAVVGAIGALKGPLHGGAPGPVLDMLDAVGTAENAVAWLEDEVTAGRRIMGMGHRIYRVRDPRAAVLERALERLEAQGVVTGRVALARAVEHSATQVLARKYPTRSLQANVEFYTAVLLDNLGMPRSLFTPLFAAGRVAGWCAHVDEQRRTGKLIRPASTYVGAMPTADA